MEVKKDNANNQKNKKESMFSKWSPTDIITVILAVTICMVVLVSVISPLITGTPLSEKGVDVLDGIMIAMISLVSAYLGSRQK